MSLHKLLIAEGKNMADQAILALAADDIITARRWLRELQHHLSQTNVAVLESLVTFRMQSTGQPDIEQVTSAFLAEAMADQKSPVIDATPTTGGVQ